MKLKSSTSWPDREVTCVFNPKDFNSFQPATPMPDGLAKMYYHAPKTYETPSEIRKFGQGVGGTVPCERYKEQIPYVQFLQKARAAGLKGDLRKAFAGSQLTSLRPSGVFATYNNMLHVLVSFFNAPCQAPIKTKTPWSPSRSSAKQKSTSTQGSRFAAEEGFRGRRRRAVAVSLAGWLTFEEVQNAADAAKRRRLRGMARRRRKIPRKLMAPSKASTVIVDIRLCTTSCKLDNRTHRYRTTERTTCVAANELLKCRLTGQMLKALQNVGGANALLLCRLCSGSFRLQIP